MDKKDLIHEINQLKKEKNAIILAHNYQNPEIQDIADYVGDSLGLARVSANLKENLIVFCGVFFMAETAHILSPQKKVLLPVLTADCPMARMINKDEVIELKKKYPKAAVVTYVNSTADVKAESDVCCTSSNALNVVNSLDNEQIIFIPDKNLGMNIARFVAKEFFYHDGFCPTHEEIDEQEILDVKKALPDAELIMHPEVNPDIAKYADKLLSTGGILNYAKLSKNKKLIIGTEMGMVHRLKKEAPSNHYYNIGRDMVCPNMKKIYLEDVYECLKNESNEVILDEKVRIKSKNAIDRMLEIS